MGGRGLRGASGEGRRPVGFTFEGRRVTACEGDTVAAALLAHGVRVFGRSAKLHRPRGYRCGNGGCSCCAMRVDGLPGVRTCVTPVRDGMTVEREHAWPSAGADLLRAAELAAPLLHAGFYYRPWLGSPRVWPRAERLLARAAGQGELPTLAAVAAVAAQARLEVRREAGVLVVGGGPAGLAAAVASARAGAPTLLVERHAELGGGATGAAGGRAVADLARQVARLPDLDVLAPAEAVGWYHEDVLAVVAGPRLVLVEPNAVVLATGGHELVLPFVGGDLPGVMTAGAARRLLRAGVRPGRRAVVVTDRADGHRLAAELAAAGVEVACVAERRPADALPQAARTALAAAGARLLPGLRDMRARGLLGVRAVTLLAGATTDGRRARTWVACDLVCMAVGARPADELARQRLASGAFVLRTPASLRGGAAAAEPGASRVDLFGAGLAAGAASPAQALADGEAAGLAAAAAARADGMTSGPGGERAAHDGPLASLP